MAKKYLTSLSRTAEPDSWMGGMLKKILAAGALLALFSQGAAAQFVDWRFGTAVVTAVNQVCIDNGITVGTNYDARYRHPNLGDNGNQARLSLFSRRSAHNFIMNVDFNNTFQTATASAFIGGGFVTNNSPQPYQPQIRMTKRTPGTITDTTPNIYMAFKVRGFFVDLGVTDCNLDLQVAVLRPAGDVE